MEIVKTSKIAAFLDTAAGGATAPTWSRVRKQNELKLKYDATTDEENYVDEDSPTTSLERYAVSFDGEMTCYKGDPLFDYLDELRQSRATGIDCVTDCLVVYIYDNTDDSYAAEKNKCSVQITDFGGEGGGGKASISYTVNFNGNHERGVCTITEGKPSFTKSA